jgi:uncharacterized membrane protein YgcG
MHAAGFRTNRPIYRRTNHRRIVKEALEGFKVGRYLYRWPPMSRLAVFTSRTWRWSLTLIFLSIGRRLRPPYWPHGEVKDAKGVAISLVTDADVRQVERIEDFLRARLQDIFPSRSRERRPRSSDRGGGGRGGGGRGGSSRGGSWRLRGGGSRGGRSGSSRGRR